MQTKQQPAATTRVQGLVTDGRLIASRDGRYVTIYFADGSKIREHRNRILSVLALPFTAEAPTPPSDEAPKTLTTGYVAKTRMLLSKDGNYLTIFFPGGRFSRHINYVKAVLGLPYVAVAKSPAM